MESHKKRHRRTKAELLMDPVYCQKHGIKLQNDATSNAEKSAKSAKISKAKVEKAAIPVRKRHRRTKAELLMDPVYCQKHGIGQARPQKAAPGGPKEPEKSASAPKRAAEKAAKPAPTRDQKIAMAERKHLPKVYKAWEEVQRRLTDMENDVMEFVRKMDPTPREFLDLDTEAGRMEDAFSRFENEVDKRSREG